ncbi:hypothetical protein [Alloprevotella tannerae]
MRANYASLDRLLPANYRLTPPNHRLLPSYDSLLAANDARVAFEERKSGLRRALRELCAVGKASSGYKKEGALQLPQP